jgi:hypothetical protein
MRGTRVASCSRRGIDFNTRLLLTSTMLSVAHSLFVDSEENAL